MRRHDRPLPGGVDVVAIWRCFVSARWRSVADDEDAGGGFDDVVGDGFELVDLEYSRDLWEEALEETEVAAGDALDRGDGLRVREVLGVEGAAESFPVAVEDEEELVASEWAVAV